jgi:hypothetical protein
MSTEAGQLQWSSAPKPNRNLGHVDRRRRRERLQLEMVQTDAQSPTNVTEAARQ